MPPSGAIRVRRFSRRLPGDANGKRRGRASPPPSLPNRWSYCGGAATPAAAVSGISGVSSRQWIFSLSCTMRRKKNRSTPISEHPDADHLLLRAAVAAGSGLEPAEADDRQDQAPDGEDARDRRPDPAQLDRAWPVRPVPAQEHEPGEREHVGEHVPEVARGEDAEDVADEEDEADVDRPCRSSSRCPGTLYRLSIPSCLIGHPVPRDAVERATTVRGRRVHGDHEAGDETDDEDVRRPISSSTRGWFPCPARSRSPPRPPRPRRRRRRSGARCRRPSRTAPPTGARASCRARCPCTRARRSRRRRPPRPTSTSTRARRARAGDRPTRDRSC